MIDLIFDTETTGLTENSLRSLDKQPHIIEFYGCLLDRDTFTVVGELDLLIKPPIKITPEITKITGITNDMVRDAPRFADVAGSISDLLSKADRKVAHNEAFDHQMLLFEFARLDICVPFPKERICTVEQTEHINGYRMKLTDLHEYLFGTPFKGAHRAKVDVEALTRCYVELIKRGEI